MLGMVPYHRPKSGHITCYLNRTYHVLLTHLLPALDNRPLRRHPDCPLGPSLVVSRIALTVRRPTYRYRSEQFAATILCILLATAIFDDRDVRVHGADQFSCADDYLRLSNLDPGR